ncbi:hypothetical protein [Eubacterium pyruvativorans]|uniref:hypothetical protein n=1 Tax=Eubacterium pyruvativorans TaxID=155865 RepID=UPI003F8C6F08
MTDYEKVTDRYGIKLRKPKEKPTLLQSVLAWAVVNELVGLGYPKNLYEEPRELVNYHYQLGRVIDKARKVVRMKEKEGNDGAQNNA